MLNRFKWNTTTKFIVIILLVLSVCYFLNNDLNLEGFFDGNTCPDRLYFDGHKYYLFRVGAPLQDKINPLTYDSYEEYLMNKPKDCPQLGITKPHQHKKSNKAKEPILPYQWKCQRKTAEHNAKRNDCLNEVYTRFSKKECDKLKISNNDFHVNYNMEQCMVDNLLKENKDINKQVHVIKYAPEGLIRVGATLGEGQS